jgi:hypothetical protein
MRGYCSRFACLVLVFWLLPAHGATRLEKVGPSVQLSVVGRPDLVVDTKWEGDKRLRRIVQIDLESKLYNFAADDWPPKFVLRVVRAEPTARVFIRQRSVSRLVVSDDGSTFFALRGESRGKWSSPREMSDVGLIVLPTTDQRIDLNRSSLRLAFIGQPRGLMLAKSCKSQHDAPCRTNTEPEFEVIVTERNGRVSKSIVRVVYPDGC